MSNAQRAPYRLTRTPLRGPPRETLGYLRLKTDGLSGAYDRGELALISLVGQHGHEGEPGKHLLEQLEALAVKFLREIRDPGDVTARTREALDEAQRLGIGSGCHDDGDCGRRVHGGADCDRAAGYDNGRVELSPP